MPVFKPGLRMIDHAFSRFISHSGLGVRNHEGMVGPPGQEAQGLGSHHPVSEGGLERCEAGVERTDRIDHFTAQIRRRRRRA